MSMETAVHAALYGPEVKKLKVYDHEFNVKPAGRSHYGSKLIVSGQISHHLSLRPDDQVYYIIVLENAVIQDMKQEIARGGLAPIAAEILSALAAYFLGIPVPPDQLESVGRALGRLYDGSWESAAAIMIANIGVAVSAQESKARPAKGYPVARLAVFPRDGGTKKTIIGVTTDGRLAQLWDDRGWNLDFPAEAAGARELRF